MNVGIVWGGGGGSAPVFMLAAWRLGTGGGGKEMLRSELCADYMTMVDLGLRKDSTGEHRSKLGVISALNSIFYRFGLPNHDSTTFYNETQKRLNNKPQGVPEALDRSFRHQIQFSTVWAFQITIL